MKFFFRNGKEAALFRPISYRKGDGENLSKRRAGVKHNFFKILFLSQMQYLRKQVK